MHFLASNLRELAAALHQVGYWLLYALLTGQLLATLWYLRRLKEWHHGYLAMIVGVIPWWPARIAALVLFADELYQHVRQELAKRAGRPMNPDDSPLHRLYVWAYRAVFR
ncbi:MAG TPA: hypothetical protein VFK04_07975 [Gemmatimonadaceae bacterium]|nr:hypothetical protein [Gemmatimonadaceae bacterium]